jgi:hypothetical protein
MTKPYYKAIILVLASHDQPIYRFFKKAWESYLYSDPRIRVFFTYGHNPTLIPKEYDMVYNDIPECFYPGMITKTVRSLDEIDRDYNYDFLIRTNLSTFWIFDRLLTRLEHLPTNRCLAGRLGAIQPNFITGTSMILSPDCVRYIVEENNFFGKEPPQVKYEDNLMSRLLTEQMSVSLIDQSQYTSVVEKYLSYDQEAMLKHIEEANKKNQDNYRVKNFRGDRMQIDTEIMKLLCKTYYNKEIGD